MALNTPAPTDQRAGVRPISFVLDNFGAIGPAVTLPVRPEDLTRSEPARVAVHQTLGRDVQGWVDDFGQGLPSVTIAGHTGWRYVQGLGKDGAELFEALNDLLVRQYPRAKQAAVDAGIDPRMVKLIFVDLLDDFTWSVVPQNFVLRRSRSRPLLFQYQITLQAISTTVDNPLRFVPGFGSVAAGLSSLDQAIADLGGLNPAVSGWVNKALGVLGGGLAPIGAVVGEFVKRSGQVFGAVSTLVKTVTNGATSAANQLISLAKGMAQVGKNVFATLGAITGLPGAIKSQLLRVKRAYTEVVCIFSNSLRPRRPVEAYSDLYGASNCSSTTGGASASAYVGSNVFDMIDTNSRNSGVSVSAGAVNSLSSLSRFDPVLAPMSPAQIADNLKAINAGVRT